MAWLVTSIMFCDIGTRSGVFSMAGLLSRLLKVVVGAGVIDANVIGVGTVGAA